MGNAARLLQAQGGVVAGSDQSVYPPMSTALAEAGIELHEGFDAARLAAWQPDRVIVGNAVSRGNPEVEWLLDTRAIPFFSLPEWIGADLVGRRSAIVIAGTHGKTTTSCLTAHLLRRAGADPGWLIGGLCHDLPGGAATGNPAAPFVVEGDEYDSAFFDKRSKFVHYRPRILVLNNLEFDHADIFRDLKDVQRSFSHVIRIVPKNGYILYNGDDPALAQLLPVPWAQCFSVGTGSACDLRIASYGEGPSGASFHLRWRGALWGKVNWRQSGSFNARNAAMASLAAGLALKPEDPLCAVDPRLAESFGGVLRRQQLHLETERRVIVEDFAHHPTALAEALTALRARWPGRRVIAAFEARSNTTRRSVFQSELADALGRADEVWLAPPEGFERIPEPDRLDLALLQGDLAIANRATLTADTYADFAERISERCTLLGEHPLLIVFFTNGSFGGSLGELIMRVRA